MKIIAQTTIGKEYFYNPKTARRVSERSAETICRIVNEYKFLLDSDQEKIWKVYDIDKYDIAYNYSQFQTFTIRNGIVTARNY